MPLRPHPLFSTTLCVQGALHCYHTSQRGSGERQLVSPLMTSCRSISLWLSLATTSLPTVCCQFWASGSGSRSDSWPRSSSSRLGRRASVQNPKLGDSILLGETRWRLSVTGGGQTWGVSPTLLPNLPVLGPGKPGGQKRGCTTNRPAEGTAGSGTPNRDCCCTHHSPAAHFGGEGRCWVLKRPVERMSGLSHPGLPGPQDASGRSPPRAPPTWWRGWRQMRRLTGGGGRPLPRRPCPRRCESGARSPPSGTASSPPGPSGFQSGPGESLSVNWMEQQETLGSHTRPALTCSSLSGPASALEASTPNTRPNVPELPVADAAQ